MSRFAGKVVIVTGSSSGIGRSSAVLFAKEGASVTITGRNQVELEHTRDEIIAAGSTADKVNIVVGNITDAEVQAKLIDSTIQKFGKLNVLVNNAGASPQDPTGKKSFEMSDEIFHKNMEINVLSILQVSRLARPHLIAQRGEIVNIGSILGLGFACPSTPFYAISKAAVDQLTRAMAIDLISHGVRVNCVSPGIVATKFLNNTGVPDFAVKKVWEYFADHKDCAPSGQVGTPEEIADVIAFLADRNTSNYIVGQVIVADGGSSIIMASSAHDFQKILKA